MEPPKDAPSGEPSKDTAPAESPETKPSSHVPKDVEVVHSAHHYPQNYVYAREHWNNSPPMGGHDQTRQPDPNYYIMHGYDSHRPSPYVSEHVSEYGHGSPPRDTRYGGSGAYGDEYFQNPGGDGNHITFMFSDENPNACRIV